MKRPPKALLDPLQKRLLYAATTVLWVSGAVWLYLFETSPARPLWMKIHGAAAMAFLVMFGTLLFQHVPAGWQQNRQRPSGSWLLMFCGILILTGWGLYYLGNEEWRHWASKAHILLGVGLPVLIGLHVWLGSQAETLPPR